MEKKSSYLDRAGHRIFCVTLSSYQVSPSFDLSDGDSKKIRAALDLEAVRVLSTGTRMFFTLGK